MVTDALGLSVVFSCTADSFCTVMFSAASLAFRDSISSVSVMDFSKASFLSVLSFVLCSYSSLFAADLGPPGLPQSLKAWLWAVFLDTHTSLVHGLFLPASVCPGRVNGLLG